MSPASAKAPSIDTYTVSIEHPALTEPLVVELIATSAARAISRARGTAVHMYRDARLLDAAITVTQVKRGVWPDRPNAGRDA